MLQKEVRLLVWLLGEGGACGESGVGTWTGLGVGLNSKEEELWLIDSKLLLSPHSSCWARERWKVKFSLKCQV